jgi:hypothetical protein
MFYGILLRRIFKSMSKKIPHNKSNYITFGQDHEKIWTCYKVSLWNGYIPQIVQTKQNVDQNLISPFRFQPLLYYTDTQFIQGSAFQISSHYQETEQTATVESCKVNLSLLLRMLTP